MPLTKEQEEKYLHHNSACCPICESDNMGYEGVEDNTPEIYYSYSCKDCGACWTETFTLTGVVLED